MEDATRSMDLKTAPKVSFAEIERQTAAVAAELQRAERIYKKRKRAYDGLSEQCERAAKLLHVAVSFMATTANAQATLDQLEERTLGNHGNLDIEDDEENEP